jgi:hypothetical protein
LPRKIFDTNAFFFYKRDVFNHDKFGEIPDR